MLISSSYFTSFFEFFLQLSIADGQLPGGPHATMHHFLQVADVLLQVLDIGCYSVILNGTHYLSILVPTSACHESGSFEILSILLADASEGGVCCDALAQAPILCLQEEVNRLDVPPEGAS